MTLIVFASKNSLKSAKDFFNTKKFPGKRAIYKGAMSNIELATAGALKVLNQKKVMVKFGMLLKKRVE